MSRIRVRDIAIVLVLVACLAGSSIQGREMRLLTERELQETTAGTLYYCAVKTGGWMPDSGCSKCLDIGLLPITYPGMPPMMPDITIPQNIWRMCDVNMGDDACYKGYYPMVAGHTPTCTKVSVSCSGNGFYYIAAGCANQNQLPPLVANASGLGGAACLSTRLQATNGTAPGVSCVGWPEGMF